MRKVLLYNTEVAAITEERGVGLCLLEMEVRIPKKCGKKTEEEQKKKPYEYIYRLSLE